MQSPELGAWAFVFPPLLTLLSAATKSAVPLINAGLDRATSAFRNNAEEAEESPIP